MITKLANSIAHFFVVQNITDESREMIYAYGIELLISDVLKGNRQPHHNIDEALKKH